MYAVCSMGPYSDVGPAIASGSYRLDDPQHPVRSLASYATNTDGKLHTRNSYRYVQMRPDLELATHMI
jgi:hypothetical protein